MPISFELRSGITSDISSHTNARALVFSMLPDLQAFEAPLSVSICLYSIFTPFSSYVLFVTTISPTSSLSSAKKTVYRFPAAVMLINPLLSLRNIGIFKYLIIKQPEQSQSPAKSQRLLSTRCLSLRHYRLKRCRRDNISLIFRLICFCRYYYSSYEITDSW